MTDKVQKPANAGEGSKQPPSDKIEDLQPTEEASGGVKGGPIYHGGGGGAGKAQS